MSKTYDKQTKSTAKSHIKHIPNMVLESDPLVSPDDDGVGFSRSCSKLGPFDLSTPNAALCSASLPQGPNTLLFIALGSPQGCSIIRQTRC